MAVVRSETVPDSVRGAFAQLVERLYLDVGPLLPQPPVRYKYADSEFRFSYRCFLASTILYCFKSIY